MTSQPLDELSVSTRVRKRAQYEAFEFELLDSDVRVRNASHAVPADHEYLVTIEDALPVDCTCPADANYENACKHRVAVAIRRPILDLANEVQLLADGGTRPQRDDSGQAEIQLNESPESDDCECDLLPDDFPCWECVRTGNQPMPTRNERDR
ncbi:SWIM zinc finger [Halomicrobium zhouii]|uniref:SWIM zinc finger n=1 Tax=Halomicrobium zhouii TaxID=767519 RepID=A0A1I6L283_9EURY|nr:SWIM zinc finger family protein [Halomicrobium zhouii]SFR97320.1 SWIM zinc finger [Halomicrobium zhouii]